MTITLITGEKVKVKETFADLLNVITDKAKVIAFTVNETKIVKGEYKAVETTEQFTLSHIVRYQP